MSSANATSKNVVITGTGAAATDEFDADSTQSQDKYLCHVTDSNYIFIRDIELLMSNSTVARLSACIGAFKSVVSLEDCLITQQVTSGTTALGAHSYNESTLIAGNSHFVISNGAAIDAAMNSGAGSYFLGANLSGSADYGYRTISGHGAYTGNSISHRVAAKTEVLGEIYS